MKPNILFFFTDDQRFDTLRALGNEQIHTPNLDALAGRGVVFTHGHIPGGTSGAVCMPSRAMLHSGRTLFHIEKEGQSIPDDHTTMGECFLEAGYTCFGTGKWHNGRRAFARSFNCGDEIFFGGMGDHWNVPAYRYDPEGRYDAECAMVADPFFSREVTYRECDHIEAGKHSTDLFADASIEFLKERDRNTPFFMYVSLMAPHDPRTMPQEFLDMYEPADIELPENFLPEHPIDTGALKIRDEVLAAFPRDPGEIKIHIAEYYAMISHLDSRFGHLVDTLKETGDYEDTIIVFAGDNGLAVGQHGLMGKQNLYDHSVRVPLIFTGPGIPQAETDSLAYLSDIFPTLCGLADIDVPGSVEGQDLAPCFGGKDIHDILYLVYCDTIRGVTDGTHKLIEYAGGESQLFDLKADPKEMHNLLDDDPSHPRAAELRQELVRLAAEWDDESHPHGKKFWSARAALK
jgi:arylsulfatase A-like enzyme